MTPQSFPRSERKRAAISAEEATRRRAQGAAGSPSSTTVPERAACSTGRWSFAAAPTASRVPSGARGDWGDRPHLLCRDGGQSTRSWTRPRCRAAAFEEVGGGNYTLAGRRAEARALFERRLSLRNDVGLLAEEYHPRLGRQLGNFPQAFSHVPLIMAALNLERHAEAARVLH